MSDKQTPEINKLGEKLIKLGQAMQDPKTTLRQLVILADECGLVMQLRLSHREIIKKDNVSEELSSKEREDGE